MTPVVVVAGDGPGAAREPLEAARPGSVGGAAGDLADLVVPTPAEGAVPQHVHDGDGQRVLL